MSLSLESSHDDRRLARYLLGLLSDEETERLDESSIVDDDIAWRLRTIENALVDGYARGALPADIIGPFEACYLSSPRRRAKVRFAARFVRTVDAADAAEAAATEATATLPVVSTADAAERTVLSDLSARSERRFPWRTFWTLRTLRVTAAAALALIAGALVLRGVQWERARHDGESGLTTRVGPASEPPRQVDDPSQIPSAGAERDRPRVTEPSRTATPPSITGQPAPPAPARPTLAVVLFPQTRSANTNRSGTTGSAGDAEPVIAVPRDADGLVLDLRLDISDFSRYAAGLMDLSSHRTVWRSARVAPASSADRPAVSITVPASVLASQSYALELSGVAASGDTEVVAVYVFRIVRGR